MNILVISMVSMCLLTHPVIGEEDLGTKGRSYEDGESRDGSYGSSSYGYGSYNNHYQQPYPIKHVALDLGIPLVVGGLGLGLGVGALKGLVLGAILGKKKYNLFHSLKHGGGGYGGIGGGYGGYGNYGGGGGYGHGYGSHYGGYGNIYGGYGSGSYY